ncbi:hypothetical protein BT63DRAFT_317742 [Microthyrium microscopicum]|uniref:F-box domain-containing protein n=1 Tax=Microthyrium microscopicum TaxID=703497 RepID=A0A6A6U3A6_9PEZI|nr:hypothetical protein BT63DRAFT_317742 [Microthyrium microscopicum]
MTASQRALSLPEICYSIIEQFPCQPNPHPLWKHQSERIRSEQNRDWLKVALVSRCFLEPALNVMWKVVWRLDILLRLFPVDLVNFKGHGSRPGRLIINFNRSMTAQDWSRFDYYAPRVTALRTIDTGDANQALERMLAIRPLSSDWLPNLRELCFTWDPFHTFQNTVPFFSNHVNRLYISGMRSLMGSELQAQQITDGLRILRNAPAHLTSFSLMDDWCFNHLPAGCTAVHEELKQLLLQSDGMSHSLNISALSYQKVFF